MKVKVDKTLRLAALALNALVLNSFAEISVFEFGKEKKFYLKREGIIANENIPFFFHVKIRLGKPCKYGFTLH